MNGKPIKQAIAAAEVLIGQLEGSDTVSVVAYDNKVTTVVAPQKVNGPRGDLQGNPQDQDRRLDEPVRRLAPGLRARP